MKLKEKGIEIDFSDALDAVKFDDPKLHKLSHCMKSVDLIVELKDSYLFVEVKDPSNPKAQPEQIKQFRREIQEGKICIDLYRKFRDTWIYRWALRKVDKPIHYLSLITLEDALLNSFQSDLRKKLPYGIGFWNRQLVTSCFVLNIETWNRNFPLWPVIRKNP